MSQEEIELKYLEELIIEGNRSMQIIAHLENRLAKTKLKKTSKKQKKINKIKSIRFLILKKITKMVMIFNKKELPKINKLSDLKVVSIIDEFSFECFKYELNLYPITKKNYKKEIKKLQPHILLVESAWRGNKGQWSISKDLEEIKELVYYCKRKGIITVFWNKEDPVHFFSFIKKAQYFDYIFTTDEDSVEHYKEKTNKQNVFSLPFAAQPRLHNPIKEFERRQEKSVFAGTFYKNKYPERFEALVYMLHSAKKYGLDIYDRNYKIGNKFYKFPHLFEDNIIGNLPYKDINKAYKGYMVNLNINTVTKSETMFSRRVFEVLACNTPVVSNYSLGIEMMFPNIVLMGSTFQEFDKHFNRLFNDYNYYKKIAFLGLRTVLNNHTYKHRVYTMLERMNLNIDKQEKAVLIVCKVNNKAEFNKVCENFNQQSYKNKHLLIISDTVKTEDYQLIKNNEVAKINNIMKDKSIDYFGVFSPCNLYGSNYISDLMMHDQYLNDCHGICKNSYYSMKEQDLKLNNPNNEYIFIKQNNLDRSIIKKEKTEILINYLTDLSDVTKIKCFSSDYYNFVENYDKLSKKELEKIII